MNNNKFTPTTVVALILLGIFTLVAPFFLEDIKNCIVATEKFWPVGKTIIQSLKTTLSQSSISSAFAVVIGAFSISTAIYVILLQLAGNEHRGYIRKEYTSAFPNILFIIQFIYFVVTALLYLFDSENCNNFLCFSFVITLILSFVMILNVLFYSSNRILDYIIKAHIVRLVNFFFSSKKAKIEYPKLINKIYKEFNNWEDDKPLTDDWEDPNSQLEHKYAKLAKRIDKRCRVEPGPLYEILRKVSYDAGSRFANDDKQILDKLFRSIIYLIVKSIYKEQSIKKANVESIYPPFTCIYYITQFLITGFKDYAKQKSDRNEYLIMLQELYLTLLDSIKIHAKKPTILNFKWFYSFILTILKKEVSLVKFLMKPIKKFRRHIKHQYWKSIIKEKRYKIIVQMINDQIAVFILTIMISSAFDYLDIKEMSKFINNLTDYQYKPSSIHLPESVFNRIIYALYGRGYYLTEQGRFHSGDPTCIFVNIKWERLKYTDYTEKDLIYLWQLWSKMDNTCIYGAPTCLRELCETFKTNYSWWKMQNKQNTTISLLLYGKE